MKKTLEVLNRLVREKIIDDYAIGRLKDKLRVQMLQLSKGFSESQFQGLLSTFNLKERFDKWQLQ